MSHAFMEGMAWVGQGFSQAVLDEQEGIEGNAQRGLSAHVNHYRLECEEKSCEVDEGKHKYLSAIGTVVNKWETRPWFPSLASQNLLCPASSNTPTSSHHCSILPLPCLCHPLWGLSWTPISIVPQHDALMWWALTRDSSPGHARKGSSYPQAFCEENFAGIGGEHWVHWVWSGQS